MKIRTKHNNKLPFFYVLQQNIKENRKNFISLKESYPDTCSQIKKHDTFGIP